MSAENFIKIFKTQYGGSKEAETAYKNWSNLNRTWLNKNRDELEDMGLSRRVGFAMTQDIADKLNVRQQFDTLTKEIKNKPNKRGPYLDEKNDIPIVVFPGVAFKGGIEKTLDKYFPSLTAASTSSLAKELGYVKGHVLGINTGALIGVKESLSASAGIASTVSKEELQSATKFLDVLIDHLTEMDLASSSIKNFESNILIKYRKSSTHFLVELQLEKDNAESAKLVQKLAGRTTNASTGIRGLMNPGGHQKALVSKLSNILKTQGLSDKEIVEFESSPSMKSLIVDDIVSSLSGKSKKLQKAYQVNNINVGTISQLYVNEQDRIRYTTQLNKLKAEAVAYKNKLKAKAKTATIAKNITYSLASLQALINDSLQNVISANMGSGTSAGILNYQTGRFAASAKVERMSQSREGMITAFYSYMKNPYQTFEPWYAQGSPKTRDPKLLIAKSIREIAATKVGNRLRAVST